MPSLENESYALSRGYAANNRQNVQFYIWTDGGFVLHPNIPRDSANLRIAEIGVGTGIWLTHLSRILPPDAHIDGFDIDLTASPPSEWLPHNVSVRVLDCLQPMPQDLVGTYDIVHVQLFHLAVQNNDPAPIITNFVTLLKPGGYISWGEYDYSKWTLMQTSPTPTNDDTLTKLMDYAGTIGGSKPSWTRDDWPTRLPRLFAEQDLINVAADMRMLSPELVSYQLDTALAACEEMSVNVLDALGGGEGDEMRRMIEHVQQNRKSIGYNVGRLTVIGQKPK